MCLARAGERQLPGLVIRHEPADIDVKGGAGCAERDVADELSQISWVMSGKARALKPAACQRASSAIRRSVMPPSISPSRISFIALWCASPGPFSDAPNPSATPSRTLAVGMWAAIRSPAPSPFWMVRTSESGRIDEATMPAASPTPLALVAMI